MNFIIYGTTILSPFKLLNFECLSKVWNWGENGQWVDLICLPLPLEMEPNSFASLLLSRSVIKVSSE